jgi:hypothetical protein
MVGNEPTLGESSYELGVTGQSVGLDGGWMELRSVALNDKDNIPSYKYAAIPLLLPLTSVLFYPELISMLKFQDPKRAQIIQTRSMYCKEAHQTPRIPTSIIKSQHSQTLILVKLISCPFCLGIYQIRSR